jgi:hypothetical protein
MYSSTHSLTSALDGGEWSASLPCHFTPKEIAPGTHWIGGWVGPRAVLNAVAKRTIPSPRRESNPRTPIVQPVAQRYTNWAITALSLYIYTHIRIYSFKNIFVKYLTQYKKLYVFIPCGICSTEWLCYNFMSIADRTRLINLRVPYKRRISWLSERLLDSQGGFCSMELLTVLFHLRLKWLFCTKCWQMLPSFCVIHFAAIP